ncbi:MAG: hypothetical protein UMV23_00265 [Halanaerobium sp.]|nr:hypothetical protein [Halanaerobium sp.]
MKVFYNEQYQEDIDNLPRLKSFITGIMEVQDGTQVIQINVDGQFTDPADLEELDEFEDDIEIIEISCEEPEKLIQEAIHDGREFLPQLTNHLELVAEYFQAGRIGEATHQFIQSYEALDWLNYILNGLKLYYLEPSFHNHQQLEDDIKKYNSTIEELMKAWEQQDYVLISDLLEYELKEDIKMWHQHFNELDEILGV